MSLDVSKCRLMIMSNAQAIIDAIDGFLDRFMLKKNKLTTADLLAFVEAKWAEADDGKYDIHQGCIIIGRMVNEYARAKDVDFAKMAAKQSAFGEEYLRVMH